MTSAHPDRNLDFARLDIRDHRRDSAGLTYVYPVLSRRAGGISVGVNLNPNNACNWRCVYCQVPNLRRGAAPPINIGLLDQELRGFLSVWRGEMSRAGGSSKDPHPIKDIAISGNGEPTSAREFPDVVNLIVHVLRDYDLKPPTLARLITNGSLMRHEFVRRGVEALGSAGGEAWFKVDGASVEAIRRTNGVARTPVQVIRDLARCSDLCPTWIQTCLFAWDGRPPSASDVNAYLELIDAFGPQRLRGVMLYGLARDSHQPEAGRLSALAKDMLEDAAEKIRRLGLTVRVSP
jgi:wyosine [tRNA(Phe)-imidazoG37] synthetase (radical SAM superfamily)